MSQTITLRYIVDVTVPLDATRGVDEVIRDVTSPLLGLLVGEVGIEHAGVKVVSHGQLIREVLRDETLMKVSPR